MNYCSIDDIQAVISNSDLIQLTNDAGGDTIDISRINDAIGYANIIIDGYLRGRYSLPLSSTPDEVKYLAVDLAIYRLYSRRMYTDVPDSVLKKYYEVVKTLLDIQRGAYNLEIKGFDNPSLKTNKNNTPSSLNKYFNKTKWDDYDAWLS